MNNFREDWALISGLSEPKSILSSGKPKTLEEALAISQDKVLFDLSFWAQKNVSAPKEEVAALLDKVVICLKDTWLKEVSGLGTIGLIELLLSDPKLSPAELLDLLKALPYSLMTRIVDQGVIFSTGVHAILAIELLRRRGDLDYGVFNDGQTYLEVYDPNKPSVKVYVDDTFNVVDSK